ncbi:MAG: hypothetical protein Q9174_001441 [Haloplaca sp. 1 TL-2023]
MAHSEETAPLADMFRPPINRAMKTLDRSFFRKEIKLAAACVLDQKNISVLQKELDRDMLWVPKVIPITQINSDLLPDKTARGLLLKPDIKVEDETSWGLKIRDLVNKGEIIMTPYQLEMTYRSWRYHDIMAAILPEDEQSEIPVGFSAVGHVGTYVPIHFFPHIAQRSLKAHLNLRDQYLPYKSLIASVLLDKNPTIATVINKLDDVGEENEFRTFRYEVLSGRDDMNVQVKEQDCVFNFDYSKVYWNTRLSTEHKRLVKNFKPGEAVCDVMAGVGPFAIPAGKKKVFVWANDLNPDSYKYLVRNAKMNKQVLDFMLGFCVDGRSFIRTATAGLLKSDRQVTIRPQKPSRTKSPSQGKKPAEQPKPAEEPKLAEEQKPPKIFKQPKTFSHYVLNLPATAITFLPSFIGLFEGQESLFTPHTDVKLPMIHVYCFAAKTRNDDDLKIEKAKIRERVGEQLGYVIEKEGHEEMVIRDVRDVAPQKSMFCVSFRLPREVAFRKRGEKVEGGKVEGEQVEGEKMEGEKMEGEKVEGEKVEGEKVDSDAESKG